MLTLWDLLDPIIIKLAPRKKPVPRDVVALDDSPCPTLPAPPQPIVIAQSPPRTKPRAARPTKQSKSPKPADSSDDGMQAKYDAVTKLMLDTYRIRVRKWRSGMCGIAWYVTYRDGTRVNLIEAPRPKGPMSAAVFLHEIGHHAIGFNVYKPRCLEEYHAWRWSLEAMQQHNLNITDAVRLRMHRSLWYAVQKAKRRGIKSIPAELTPFLEKPSFARRRKRAA
jgi:hypothetical protein